MHAFALSENLVLGFPVVILTMQVSDHAEINPDLLALLHAERAANPAPSISSVGGWQSTVSLLRRNNPAVNRLMEHVHAATIQISSQDLGVDIRPYNPQVHAEVWGNIMGDRDATRRHNHGKRADWSGVYYVDAERNHPDSPGSGTLELHDPKVIQPFTGPVGDLRRPNRDILIKPANGLIVMFPAYLMHEVQAFHAANPGDERVSIAFNVTVTFPPDEAQATSPHPSPE